MFLFVCLLSGCADTSNGDVVHNFVIGGFSVTSRRGPPTLRHQNYMPLSRRDVGSHVATSKLHASVTSRHGLHTSRRELVQVSVTSRRGPERRDVVWSCSLSRRDIDPNVATWAYLLSVTS